ncbi:MAG: trehalose-6-phosphate synthase, partial [Phycisphaerales bacterium JB039]
DALPIYHDVNERFAEAAASAAGPSSAIWVHDYHLQLAPAMLRARRPDLRIGFFLHIPFPDRRLFGRLPWRRESLEGALGADVVGFQTREDAEHFASSAGRYTGADVEGRTVTRGDRETHVAPFPISIDAARIDEIARSDAVVRAAAEHRRRLNGRTVLLGVDRLDYTKGIPNRLRAFQRLLRSGRVSPDEVTLVQSCVPTRENIEAYAALRSEVEQIVGEINGEFSSLGRECVHYLRQNLPAEELIALYAAADVALVTPLRDGMNLIAKEFVAARHDESGSLVLSECTGAAEELSEAIIVNPHDLAGMGEAMERAVRLGRAEQQRRMRSMRATVMRNDVYRWADSFMSRLRPAQGRVRRGPTSQPSGAGDGRSRALAATRARALMAPRELISEAEARRRAARQRESAPAG